MSTETGSDKTVDAVVVGAGLAGLSAARELVRAGRSVVVLEGRDRVGGRTWSATVAGQNVDAGASFIGPGQDALLALTQEFGLHAYPTYIEGRHVLLWGGKKRFYRGATPPLTRNPISILASAAGLGILELLARKTSTTAPWEAKWARALDSFTLGGVARLLPVGSSAREALATFSRSMWGCEPDEISLLYTSFFARADDGFQFMLSTEGGSQDKHFHEGTQEISTRLAAQLPEGSVALGAAVRRIDYSDPDTVVVTTDKLRITTRAVIVATAPQHRAGIEFVPALPAPHTELIHRAPQGTIGKVYAVYDKPFWREQGLSGHAVLDTEPLVAIYDLSPEDGSRGVLMGFTGGDRVRAFQKLSEPQRRAQALSAFATAFGDAARSPLGYIDQIWAAEDFAPGGPCAPMPPGAFSRYGRYLREPVGPIRWAGSETADRWVGYMDGAITSGRRAAAEVLHEKPVLP